VRLARRLRKRFEAVRDRGWRDAPGVSNARAVVIGGCPRSGTTLLRKLFDEHPRICCGPESALLLPRPRPAWRLAPGFGIPVERIEEMRRSSPSQTRYVESFFAAYCELRGRERWAEKTPRNVEHIDWLWEHFPEARFVHVIRDGRDTAASLRTHPEARFEGGQRYVIPRVRPIRACIRTWVALTGMGMRHRGDPRYVEVRYEDLVRDPRPTLEQLFEFLGEPLDPSTLDRVSEAGTPGSEQRADQERHHGRLAAAGPISAVSVGRWKRDLTADEVVLFKQLAGARLIELGYVSDDGW
jgi:protein-tyrosine sulfotransferase